MPVVFNNTWGIPGGLEAQRADLWQVDCRPILSVINNPGGVMTSDYFRALVAGAPSSDGCKLTTQRLSLPELQVGARVVSDDVHRRNLPGYDEPTGITRLELIYGANLAGTRQSVFNLFEAWRLLALAGQRIGGQIPLPLVSSAAKPAFRIDLPIELLRGSDNGAGLVAGARYVLLGAWCSDVQVNDLDQASTSILKLTATLQCYAMDAPKQDSSTGVGASSVPESVRQPIVPAPGRRSLDIYGRSAEELKPPAPLEG